MNDDQDHSKDGSQEDRTRHNGGQGGPSDAAADSEETVILPRQGARRAYRPSTPSDRPDQRPATNSTSGRADGPDSERTQTMGTVPGSQAPGQPISDAAANERTQSLPPVGRSQSPHRGDQAPRAVPPAARSPERTQVFPTPPPYRAPGHAQSEPAWQGHFVGAGTGEEGSPGDQPLQPENPPRRNTNKILLRVLQVLAAFLILFIGVGIGSFVSGTPATRSTPQSTATVTSTATATATTTATPTEAATTVAPPTVTQTQTQTVTAPADTVTVTGPAQTVTAPPVTRTAPAQTVTAPPVTTTVMPGR